MSVNTKDLTLKLLELHEVLFLLTQTLADELKPMKPLSTNHSLNIDSQNLCGFLFVADKDYIFYNRFPESWSPDL